MHYLGATSNVKPSYIKYCSFTRNFNTAFGAFGASNIPFVDNIIYHTVGSSVRISDDKHMWVCVYVCVSSSVYCNSGHQHIFAERQIEFFSFFIFYVAHVLNFSILLKYSKSSWLVTTTTTTTSLLLSVFGH